jgi:hypothetical protein
MKRDYIFHSMSYGKLVMDFERTGWFNQDRLAGASRYCHCCRKSVRAGVCAKHRRTKKSVILCSQCGLDTQKTSISHADWFRHLPEEKQLELKKSLRPSEFFWEE